MQKSNTTRKTSCTRDQRRYMPKEATLQPGSRWKESSVCVNVALAIVAAIGKEGRWVVLVLARLIIPYEYYMLTGNCCPVPNDRMTCALSLTEADAMLEYMSPLIHCTGSLRLSSKFETHRVPTGIPAESIVCSTPIAGCSHRSIRIQILPKYFAGRRVDLVPLAAASLERRQSKRHPGKVVQHCMCFGNVLPWTGERLEMGTKARPQDLL
eukprot:4484411-Amphidinium_carterae.1